MPGQQCGFEDDAAVLEPDAQSGRTRRQFRVEVAFEPTNSLDTVGDARRHTTSERAGSQRNGRPKCHPTIMGRA
jgi:hypothetical protein